VCLVLLVFVGWACGVRGVCLCCVFVIEVCVFVVCV